MHNFLKVIPAILLFFIASITFNSCTYEKATDAPCQATNSDTVSFSNDILPLFNTYCGISGCHSGGNPAGSLNLEDSKAYAQLSKQGTGYINTAKPTFSILYSQMISASDPMPPTGKLDQCKIDLILKWITQGAANN